MSKTYIYLIVLFGVYLFIVKGLKEQAKETNNEHVSDAGVTHGGGGARR